MLSNAKVCDSGQDNLHEPWTIWSSIILKMRGGARFSKKDIYLSE